jgi:hypothetical protein
VSEGSIRDFEDLLLLLERHEVRYLVVGGLAFIYHAKPRYTKDMDLWIEPSPENLHRANRALSDFGSPILLSLDDPDEIAQLGVAPNRIDLLQRMGSLPFEEAWATRIVDAYGEATANWIALDELLRIKEEIDHPRHREDARVLREVKRLRERREGESDRRR